MVQIGLPCEPEWICSLITWILMALVFVAIFGFLKGFFRKK